MGHVLRGISVAMCALCRYMYAEGMKLAKRYEEEEAALAEQLTVRGWKGGGGGDEQLHTGEGLSRWRDWSAGVQFVPVWGCVVASNRG